MPWYKAGTVSVVQNSNTVNGTGTSFVTNSRVGDAFRGPDGGWYEVTNIASNTTLSISPNYIGATNAAGGYAIAPMQGYPKDSADALRALTNQFGGVLAVLGNDPTQAGVRAALNISDSDGIPEGITNKYLTNPRVLASVLTGLDAGASGAVVATDSIIAAFSKLQVAVNKTITPAQGGVSDGYIDGLIPTWNSSSSITFSPGAAFIPSTGKNLRLSAPITISGIGGLNPDVFYFAYLYENAGVAAIELSPTVYSAPYFGRARTKAGDSSRRFICALRTGAGGTLYGFQLSASNMIFYTTNTSITPFRRLSGGTAAAYTAVGLGPVVPQGCQSVVLRVSAAGQVVFISVPAAGSAPMMIADAGARVQFDFVMDGNMAITYAVAAAGGAATIDVCGYGMER